MGGGVQLCACVLRREGVAWPGVRIAGNMGDERGNEGVGMTWELHQPDAWLYLFDDILASLASHVSRVRALLGVWHCVPCQSDPLGPNRFGGLSAILVLDKMLFSVHAVRHPPPPRAPPPCYIGGLSAQLLWWWSPSTPPSLRQHSRRCCTLPATPHPLPHFCLHPPLVVYIHRHLASALPFSCSGSSATRFLVGCSLVQQWSW